MLAEMTLSVGDFAALVAVMMVPVTVIVLYMQKISRDNEAFKSDVDNKINAQQKTIDSHAVRIGKLGERKIDKVEYLGSSLATRKALERLTREVTVVGTRIDMVAGPNKHMQRLTDAVVEFTELEKAKS